MSWFWKQRRLTDEFEKKGRLIDGSEKKGRLIDGSEKYVWKFSNFVLNLGRFLKILERAKKKRVEFLKI